MKRLGELDGEKVFRGSAGLRIMNNEENEKQKWKKVI